MNLEYYKSNSMTLSFLKFKLLKFYYIRTWGLLLMMKCPQLIFNAPYLLLEFFSMLGQPGMMRKQKGLELDIQPRPFLVVVLLYETTSHYIALAVLKLIM